MTGRQDDGFVAFFRRYTQTWLHTVSTAALTAFGMLTFVNRWFAVVALAAYVLPPIIQYVRQPNWARANERGAEAGDATVEADDSAAGSVDAEDGAGGGDARRETPPEGRTPSETAATEADAAGADSAGGNAAAARTPSEAGAGTVSRGEATAANERSDGDEADEANERASESGEPAGEGEGTDGSSEPEPEPEWVVADAPTDETLFDAAVTENGAYAAGSDGVVVAASHEGSEDGEGDGWRVVLSDGPGAGSNDLTGVDAVAGGGVWVAGESGAVGRIDPESGRHVDFSAPDGDTNDVAAVAAAGSGGTETVLLADGSGQVRRGRYRDGDVAWDEATKPGSGSSIVGVALRGEVGYVCDSNDGVFRTTDAGRTFESLEFEGVNGTLTDVTAGGDAPLVSDDDGVLHRYDGSRWTPERLADDPILAVAAAGPDGVAAGEEAVYERFGSGWERASPPAVESLSGVALGERIGDGEPRAVVVGEAGTVLERRTMD